MPSVGRVGDSCQNALAKTINALFKSEDIWRQRSWPGLVAIEMATLRWVVRFNDRGLFDPVGYVTSAEAEAT